MPDGRKIDGERSGKIGQIRLRRDAFRKESGQEWLIGEDENMISYLYGEVAETGENLLILDVNGIGYEINTTAAACELLGAQPGKVKLHTYMQVREDGISLFGFPTLDELAVFKLVIGVSGIGPKGALALLSALSADELRFAVASGDAKAICRAPGIGTRTAQRIILELKDKLSLPDFFSEGESLTGGGVPTEAGGATAKNEAIQALVALGYSNADAVLAVKKAGDTTGLDTEGILKLALKQMALF